CRLALPLWPGGRATHFRSGAGGARHRREPGVCAGTVGPFSLRGLSGPGGLRGAPCARGQPLHARPVLSVRPPGPDRHRLGACPDRRPPEGGERVHDGRHREMTDTLRPVETYQAYFVPAMVTPWAGMLLDRVRPQPGHHVLDVACGTGVVARMAAPIVGSGGRVVGLDVSPAMLAVARTVPAGNHAPIEWLEEDAATMSLTDASFDLVLCQQGLQ